MDSESVKRAKTVWERGVIPGAQPDGATKDDAIEAAAILLAAAGERERLLEDALTRLTMYQPSCDQEEREYAKVRVLLGKRSIPGVTYR